MCPDVFTVEKRSLVMAQIRGGGNASTELCLITLMKKFGITGWRRRQNLYGRPDFVFRSIRLAVFVDGDFWHGHPTRSKLPGTNVEFWRKKIEGNRRRDRHVNRILKEKGWMPVRFWEGDLRRNPGYCISRLTRLISQRSNAFEKTALKGK
ncbi:MAG: very short patch repair endonuclease [Verrucomicrobium sp.]|nr:very short patch repair endonuclease [Verrucomicrobium sp.]